MSRIQKEFKNSTDVLKWWHTCFEKNIVCCECPLNKPLHDNISIYESANITICDIIEKTNLLFDDDLRDLVFKRR